MATEPAELAMLSSPAPEEEPADRRWFHASASATAAPPVRPRVPTREQLQRLARSRLAGRASSAREELHAIVDGLSDDDVEMVLGLARRLLGPQI